MANGITLSEGGGTLTGVLATQSFSPREDAIARGRGTTVADLRNVVFGKINDLRTSINELERVTEDGETRDFLKQLARSL